MGTERTKFWFRKGQYMLDKFMHLYWILFLIVISINNYINKYKRVGSCGKVVVFFANQLTHASLICPQKLPSGVTYFDRSVIYADLVVLIPIWWLQLVRWHYSGMHLRMCACSMFLLLCIVWYISLQICGNELNKLQPLIICKSTLILFF